jgi:hypothetical protein
MQIINFYKFISIFFSNSQKFRELKNDYKNNTKFEWRRGLGNQGFPEFSVSYKKYMCCKKIEMNCGGID